MLSDILKPKKRRIWNKRKLVGQKPPLKPPEIWAIRIHLRMASKIRDLALFNLAIDSKLRGCDLVSLKAQDVCSSQGLVASRATITQQKTGRPVQFEITQQAQAAVDRGCGSTYRLRPARRCCARRPWRAVDGSRRRPRRIC